MKNSIRRWLLASVLLAACIATHAATIEYVDGSRREVNRVVTANTETVSVLVKEGLIRIPRSSIRSIDGMTVEQAFPTAPSAPSTTATAPATQAKSKTTAQTTPESSTPQMVETPEEPGGRLRLVILLGALLFGGAIWMRSLQAVQKSLFERRVEPRVWTTVALLLPGLGALAYFISLRAQRIANQRAMGNKTSSRISKKSGNTRTDDPAESIARKTSARKGLAFLDAERRSVKLNGDSELVSGLDHASEMLEEAILEKASDVHIEPTGNYYRVRFRLDGILHERMNYDPEDGRRVVTALKTLAEIDIAERRRAQDGRFQAQIENREVDFRVATANSIHGEKMVIRVLDHRGGIFDLPALGMPAQMLAQFQSAIHSRNGMILATGPTGSGKTSTLYAALRQLDSSKLNIMTIEDPAEYELAGATQIAVNARAGITYEAGLRSILRQDPDVIFVGEMRDTEAGTIAVRAALTGHLVFSSLHTKDAVGTITRLQDMGIERYQLASALLVVIAQRLVRVLCPHCRAPYAAAGNELATIGFSFDPGTTLHKAVGCEKCHNTGFRGRTGLFELLVVDDEMRKAIGQGIDESGLLSMAVERGFKSYRQDGAEKVLEGTTTVEEVLQAV